MTYMNTLVPQLYLEYIDALIGLSSQPCFASAKRLLLKKS